ncbi:Endonuclease/exonuclease/phosphatase [Kalmanozyma brasiliensis GHG001]|uniref:Inositol polyphosphate-related phosphatase domain-containing protein n=1 Tax=Kalmanozyma brasiliensis (strain GHG001) TaxID=1365824 RepID=V5EXC3_KALBG|nr:Endonuclease/exonuclease/phosphatase [Kalmanozyma brasiliensis GHG001]EST07064.1 Endonuclease/exonuclease/phosphatase [Kalmanozyma brasiliensis GHG001]
MSTTPDPYLLASTILTPDELPKLALVTYDPSTTQASTASSSSTPLTHTQRIFVIVSNISFNVEQCAVLIIKPRRKDPSTAILLDVIPILPDLKIEIEPQQGLTASAATPRNRPPSATTLGLSSLPQTLPTIHTLLESVVPDLFDTKTESSNAALKFTLSHSTQSASGITSDAAGLKDFLSVLKDLLKVAEDEAFSIDRSHQWMKAYTEDLSRPHHGPVKETPIFSRFSHSGFLPSTAARQEPPRPASPTSNDLRISVGSFNVNSHLPADDIPTIIGLKKWIRAEEDPDLIIVGFQEVDNSSGAYLYHSPAREEAWTRAIIHALGRRAERYRKIAAKQLVGLMILAFARAEVKAELEEVVTASVGVGLGGFVANKGAVAVRMKVGNRTLCFVNSHLSAFEGLQAMERRCWDWNEIYKRLRFRVEQPRMMDFWETPGRHAFDGEGVEREEKRFKTSQKVKEDTVAVDPPNGSNESSVDGSNDEPPTLHAAAETLTPPPRLATELTEASSNSITASFRPPSTSPPPTTTAHTTIPYVEHAILSHDLVIHFGDLNFRLDISHSEAHRLIRQRDYPTLYRYDQLESLRTSGSLFDDFHEGPLDFAPTYKFDKGTDRYDTSEKERVPAWTDRILWAVTSEWEDQGESATWEGEDGEEEKEREKQRRQGVVLQSYEAVTDLKFSDHRPVRATFLVRIR